jgi:glycosyltransferase involved in cell wall biosynthesis
VTAFSPFTTSSFGAERMTTVLTLIDYYLPGALAGGALRSVGNLIGALGKEIDFRVITRDRDWLSPAPYPNIRPGTWETVAPAKVMYLSPSDVRPSTLRRVINQTPHDVLYLNSLFSWTFTLSVLVYRRLGLLARAPVVLAPRGQLTPGAISIRGRKKLGFLTAARMAGLYDGVLWQASSPDEEREVHEHMDGSSRAAVVLAPDLPTLWSEVATPTNHAKVAGRLNATFISRIARKKNLHGAIELLRDVSAPTSLDVYGPAEDPAYLLECQRVEATLPPHVQVRHVGPLSHDEVARMFARYDLFLFPTLGENYGHVLIEALAAGCPVAVSDRTPFRDLEERGAGWVIPLEAPERWRRVLDACAAMDTTTHAGMRRAAREYARRVIHDTSALEQNRQLFRMAAASGGKAPRLNTSRK